MCGCFAHSLKTGASAFSSNLKLHNKYAPVPNSLLSPVHIPYYHSIPALQQFLLFMCHSTHYSFSPLFYNSFITVFLMYVYMRATNMHNLYDTMHGIISFYTFIENKQKMLYHNFYIIYLYHQPLWRKISRQKIKLQYG